MPSRTYLCDQCGITRRSSLKPAWRNGQPYWPTENAPQHCGKAMKPLTYEQGVAATHAATPSRIQWAIHGLHIFRRGGKRKWMPAITPRQVEQAQQQYAGYLAKGEEAREQAAKAENPPHLDPLLTLPGIVPAGWKDALYDEQH